MSGWADMSEDEARDYVEDRRAERRYEDHRELEAARRACQAARWPEHHSPHCLWCAHIAAEDTL